jgi:predicted DNA-binding transcriptional regulator AlpA
MSELQNSQNNETDQDSLILAGYLKPKDLAKALEVSERTIARWHHFREGPPRVEIGRKVYYRRESVAAWIASL